MSYPLKFKMFAHKIFTPIIHWANTPWIQKYQVPLFILLILYAPHVLQDLLLPKYVYSKLIQISTKFLFKDLNLVALISWLIPTQEVRVEETEVAPSQVVRHKVMTVA